MNDTSSSQSSLAPKRACDACHRRKVRCVSASDDGSASSAAGVCKNCKNSNLACTYDTIPQKKGPKGSRAKVISELRERQRRYSTASAAQSETTSPGSPSLTRTSNNISPDLVEACVDYFFENVYPTQPILERRSLSQAVLEMHQDIHAYCLVASLCAYMLIQSNIQLPASVSQAYSDFAESTTALGSTLVRDVLEMRKSIDAFENPTFHMVMTSFFLFGSYFCLEKQSTAWAYLRDSTTMALLLGMNREETYRQMDPSESQLKRRLYWLLFVTERAYALQAQRPLTLYDTIDLPQARGDETENEKILGFLNLISLYRPFDHTFVGLWNSSIENGTTAEWISSLQRQLSEALPRYLKTTETQAVDLKTSQQWLRIMIWQLGISHKLLSSTANEESLTFKFPMELARQYHEEARRFSQHSMEVHGIGLVKKLFDIACTLVDVMAIIPMDQSSGFEVSPREHLDQFLTMMKKLRGGQERYLPMLLSKMQETGMMTGTPRALPSSVMMGGAPTTLEDRSAGQRPTMLTPPVLKSEYSGLSGDISNTPPYVETQYDEDADMGRSYSMQPQSSYMD